MTHTDQFQDCQDHLSYLNTTTTNLTLSTLTHVTMNNTLVHTQFHISELETAIDLLSK